MSFVPPTPTSDELLLNAFLLAKTLYEADVLDIEQRLSEFTFTYNLVYHYIKLDVDYVSSQGYDIATGVQDATLLKDPAQWVEQAVVTISTLKRLAQLYTESTGRDRWRSLDLKLVILHLDERIIRIASKVLTIKQHRQEINNLVEALASALGKLSIKGSTGLSEPLQEVVIVERLFRNLYDPRIEAVTRRFGKLTI